jgi:hypothetical protein
MESQVIGLMDQVGVGVYFNLFVEWRDKIPMTSYILWSIADVWYTGVMVWLLIDNLVNKNLFVVDTKDKVRGGEDERPGFGYPDLGQVLP